MPEEIDVISQARHHLIHTLDEIIRIVIDTNNIDYIAQMVTTIKDMTEALEADLEDITLEQEQ
jgi:hypothetical protein